MAYGLLMAMADEWVELPDPRTCSHEKWEQYMSRVDVFAMDDTQAMHHREALSVYGRRLERERDETRAREQRRQDALDQADAEADRLSERCRVLQGELLRQGTVMLSLHDLHGYDDARVVAARRKRDEIAEELSAVRQWLIEADQRAVQSFHDAQ